ncbi:MAG: hypothetical protein A2W09_03090 [Deltaproteobacteria bacterium RBG_16_50_11]|nr:MAG: hypothetical protein A2W09_03090 [Deltaproteobacteria bacterium RBG_16_50_11]
MTTERQDILEDFYAGNYKVLRVTIVKPDGSPKDLNNAEVTFALFDDKGKIYVVKSSVDIEQIDIIDEPNGVADIFLLPPDTLHLSGLYRYHVNVVDENGYEETVTSGKINIFASYARRLRRESFPAHLRGVLLGIMTHANSAYTIGID